ncbi:fas-associated death domain protein [Anopheles ziemanni]|uniref:fas-associated death domain protein n=1 Tax=Anopheles coustani TaxID=139045 RepID=UPI0026590C48|nr:fas-associated death domain protein [Anopheles coustani]XP_058166575.1 fas-associated death domain protein [Anopheles ziemanni]
MEIFVQDRVLYEQLCKDYLNLKLLAQNACTSPERLERCKQLIWEDVHSRRKLSRVASFEDLLQLLEQRNLLSLLKPEVIERLELVLSSDDIAKAVKLYRQTISSHYPAIRRFYLEDLRQRDRRSLLEKEVEKIKLAEQSTVSAFHGKYLQQREAIYSLLQNQVGKEWRVFGRYLNIAEAELDEINERHRNDLKSRIYEMLIGVEQKLGESSGEQFISTLTKALENIRRKDLKRKVENMLDV